MAWPSDKSLTEARVVRLPTHICVARSQWVKIYIFVYISYMCHCWIKLPECNGQHGHWKSEKNKLIKEQKFWNVSRGIFYDLHILSIHRYIAICYGRTEQFAPVASNITAFMAIDHTSVIHLLPFTLISCCQNRCNKEKTIPIQYHYTHELRDTTHYTNTNICIYKYKQFLFISVFVSWPNACKLTANKVILSLQSNINAHINSGLLQGRQNVTTNN